MFKQAIRPIQQQSGINITAGAVLAFVGACGAYSIAMMSTKRERDLKTFGRGPAFRSLRLESVETLSHDTKRLRFQLPEKNAVSGLGLTSALLTLSKPEGYLFPVIRPYTPVSDLNEPGYLDLCVKRYPNGKASTHLHSLKPGQSLFFLGSLPSYSWKLNEASHVVLIAGGAGITPLYQLLRGILSNPQEKAKVTLVFGINTDDDALFRKEFTQYENDFPDRFEVIYTVSQPTKDSVFDKGRVTREMLERVIPPASRENSKVFCCGPPAMEAALLGGNSRFGGQGGILGELGYSKDQVFKF